MGSSLFPPKKGRSGIETPFSIALQVSLAFQQLRDFIDTKYTTRPEIAVTSLPDGEARYNELVR
ncbi:hypothetical protein E2C01_041000 [Portunus trituberculatus]|uniref:Uncharacterized protein n=1 Tax=Portunus trituberculatus TaxID=210409 RepID=A0A5B7FPR7_PORTR|nr:hypothetical protein [Portunus trituberculatus]